MCCDLNCTYVLIQDSSCEPQGIEINICSKSKSALLGEMFGTNFRYVIITQVMVYRLKSANYYRRF